MMQATIPTATPVESHSPSLRERCVGNHPIAGFFHLFFKALSALTYEFGNLLSFNYVTVFVVCTVLSAMDFWSVKNVIGRLMVGLRWWNEIQEDGQDRWYFEASSSEVHPLDAKFFWFVLIANCAMWGAFLLIAIIGQWKYIPLALIALGLSAVNASGYVKCRKDAKKRVLSWASNQAAGIIQRNPEMVSQVATGVFRDALDRHVAPQQQQSQPQPHQQQQQPQPQPPQYQRYTMPAHGDGSTLVNPFNVNRPENTV
jgi:hypothetical protein